MEKKWKELMQQSNTKPETLMPSQMKDHVAFISLEPWRIPFGQMKA